jgi:hypothetical protein
MRGVKENPVTLKSKQKVYEQKIFASNFQPERL